VVHLKAGGTPESRILAGYYDFNANISFRLRQFFGDLVVYLGRKFGRFDVVLKLELEVKKLQTYTKQLPTNLGTLSAAFNCLVVFQTFFSFLKSS